MAITPSQNTTTSYQDKAIKSGPDDGPNQPMENGMGTDNGVIYYTNGGFICYQ